jgi:hypothetical protein
MQKAVVAILTAVCATAQAAAPQPACAPLVTAQQDVIATVEAVFVAAERDDLSGFHAVTTPDFDAYDNGEELRGDALMILIAKAHAAGQKYVWQVTQPEVHVACASAWIKYVNQGSHEDATGRQDLTWLESAVLQFDGSRWRIRFVHSTRAAQRVKR